MFKTVSFLSNACTQKPLVIESLFLMIQDGFLTNKKKRLILFKIQGLFLERH